MGHSEFLNFRIFIVPTKVSKKKGIFDFLGVKCWKLAMKTNFSFCFQNFGSMLHRERRERIKGFRRVELYDCKQITLNREFVN